MCTAGDCGDVIVLSDDDVEVVCSGPSVDSVRVGKEAEENNGTTFYFTLTAVCVVFEPRYSSSSYSAPAIGPAEDMVVTFSRRPELLPHARHDCPLHPFTQVSRLVYFLETLSSKFSFHSVLLFFSCVLLRATDGAVQGPVADNGLFCEQCFCFICDKLASAVRVGTETGSDSLTES